MQFVITFTASVPRLRDDLDLDNASFSDQYKQIRNTYTLLSAII